MPTDAVSVALSTLPTPTAALLRALIPLAPHRAEEWERIAALQEQLFASVGIARLSAEQAYGRFIWRDVLPAEALTGPQRVLLEALTELPELELVRYPVYASRVLARRWLGLAPAGALFARVPHGGTQVPRIDVLRAAARAPDGKQLRAYLMTLTAVERVECLSELLPARHDWSCPGIEAVLDEAVQQLGPEAATWARAAADAWIQTSPVSSVAVERAIFVALVRAQVPIEPRWDAMVPLAAGSFYQWAMQAGLTALPEARCEAAVRARLARCDSLARPGLIALEAMQLRSLPGLTTFVLDQAETSALRAKLIEGLTALAKGTPAIAAAMAQASIKPLALAFVDRRTPRRAADLDATGRAQLERASALNDGKKRTAEAVFTNDGGDEAIVASTLEQWSVQRDGAPAYDAWLFMGDSGAIFEHGTTRLVAEIIQGGVECKDPSLRRDLTQAKASRPRAGASAKAGAKPKANAKAAKAAAKPKVAQAMRAAKPKVAPAVKAAKPTPEAASSKAKAAKATAKAPKAKAKPR